MGDENVSEMETDVLCATCGGKGWSKVQTARGERVRACKNCDKGKEAQAAWDAMNAQERADTMSKMLGKYRPKEEKYHGLMKCGFYRMCIEKAKMPPWGAALATVVGAVIVVGIVVKIGVAFLRWVF